jgi:hypothetical protein
MSDKYLKLLIDLPLESLLLFEDAYLATISWRFIVLYYKMALKVDKLMLHRKAISSSFKLE